MEAMDPNQPNQPPPQDFPAPPPASVPPGHYDFITNPAKPAKKSLFSRGGGNKNGLLIIIAGGIGLLTVILLIGSLFLGGESNSQTLLSVAQKQSELIAVADLGAEDGGTNATKSLALAVQLSVTTDQNALIAQLSKKDKLKPKDYAAEPSAEVTSQLETAQRNGRFDEVFANIIKQELTEYQRELQTADAAVSSKSIKELLAQDFENAGLLLTIPSN